MGKINISRKNAGEKNQMENNQAESFFENFETKFSQPLFCPKNEKFLLPQVRTVISHRILWVLCGNNSPNFKQKKRF